MSRAEVRGLLRDIKQQPDEPTLRLILADWLEDHGGEVDRARAEVIRAQVSGGHARGLVAAHRTAWLGAVAPWCPIARFHGGLVGVTLADGHLASSALAALADTEEWAWVDEVTLTPGSRARGLPGNPLLAELNGFGCPDAAADERLLDQLARSQWMESVRRLDLSGHPLHGSALMALLQSPHVVNLSHLILDRGHVTAALIRALGERRLRTLSMARARLADGRAIANEPGFASLEELDLADNDLTDEAARALAESPFLARVRVLTLYGNPIGPDGRRALRERFGARVLIAG